MALLSLSSTTIEENMAGGATETYGPIFLPINPEIDAIVNCEFIRSEIYQYPNKFTPYGEVSYSPRYRDDRYIYRHVILSREVKKAAEELAAKSPNGLLTETQFIQELGIDLSPGWQHFMRFKGQLSELILRRPLPEDENNDGAPKEGDEVSDEDSNGSENEMQQHGKKRNAVANGRKIKVVARKPIK